MSELKEYCGIFGVAGDPDAVNLCGLGLFALQHRGEEAAGLVMQRDGELFAHHGLGLVSEVLSPEKTAKLKGNVAIAHCRYATAGGHGLINTQPLLARYALGQVAVAHNGTLTNAQHLRRKFESQGSIFSTTSDTEVILHLIAQAKGETFIERLRHAVKQLEGAFSLLVLTGDAMYAVRDPMGFRPLVLGERRQGGVPNGGVVGGVSGGVIVASETCALDMIEAKYVREVEPGEIVSITETGVASERYAERGRLAPCVFEHIYFARPDSNVFARDVYATRKALGRELGKLHPAQADVVIPVPDSGVPAAIGFAEATGIPFDMALTRSHYVGRSFIQPAQAIRSQTVRLKLASAGSALRGKRVVVVDDSIVRGTTSRKLVELLRAAGAIEVHLRISAPPTISPCYYGIDTPNKAELLAAQNDLEGIRRFVTADSVGYLDIEAVRRAVAYREGEFCEACFTEQYPVAPSDLVPLAQLSAKL